MQALTIWQPWATLIAIGAKRIETRGWAMPHSLPGAWIALHAAANTPAAALQDAFTVPDIQQALAPLGITDDTRSRALLPHGAVLAVALVGGCLPTTTLVNKISPNERALGNYGRGRYGWLFDRVITLPEPVPAKGALGMWYLPLHVETHVRAQLVSQGHADLG